MRKFCALISALVFSGLLQAGEKPNILLILTDDQGFGDVSSHGNPGINTPHLDRLAEEGARFDRFFVEPVCAPTRAALLTGRYPTRGGVHGVTRGQENLRSDETTIAELLRDEAGYATGCFGKWHNGSQWPEHPNAQGFDEFVGFCGGHWNDYYDSVLERNGEDYPTRGFIADVITNHAEEFVRGNVSAGKPFFCYVPFNTPHTPASVAKDDWERWADHPEVESNFDRAMYALCENIDTNVGRLLALLDELKVERDTIVIFLTDNGANGPRYNAGMKGYKGSVDEGGVRVPLFVRWPEKIAGGTLVKPNVAHIDILPTLCSVAGIDLKGKTKPLDGLDISPLWFGQDFEMPTRYHYTWRNGKKWSIRSDRYRATAKTLYDLIEDPGQENNLAATKPDVHKELVAAYSDWRKSAIPETPERLSIQVGHKEWPRVSLKAHEWAVLPGEGEGIAYCSPRGYANQWIEKWTDKAAFAECPVKIVEAGNYRVTFRYACAEASAGSVFSLEGGKKDLEIAIKEPWVSAAYPASEQGPKGPGGYLSREWKDIDAGVVSFDKGETVLRLAVKQMNGGRMPAVKGVFLEREI